MTRENIVTNQNIAYTVCFTESFANFEHYSVIGYPGVPFHILGSAHIRNCQNEDIIQSSIKVVDDYFSKFESETNISVLDDNFKAQKQLTNLGFLRAEKKDDTYFIFNLEGTLSKLQNLKSRYVVSRITNEREFNSFFDKNSHSNSESFMKKLKRAFAQTKIPYIHLAVADSGKLVGFASVAIIDQAGFFMSAMVDKDYRRHGIYTLLTRERAEVAKKYHCNLLVMETASDNLATNQFAQKLDPTDSFKRYFYQKEAKTLA